METKSQRSSVPDSHGIWSESSCLYLYYPIGQRVRWQPEYFLTEFCSLSASLSSWSVTTLLKGWGCMGSRDLQTPAVCATCDVGPLQLPHQSHTPWLTCPFSVSHRAHTKKGCCWILSWTQPGCRGISTSSCTWGYVALAVPPAGVYSGNVCI